MLSSTCALAAALAAINSVSALPLTTRQESSYDYIIVGSGAAGIPLAAKLSESGLKTLLIERGPPSSGRWNGTLKAPWLESTNLTSYDVPSLYNEQFSGNFSDGIYCPDVQGAIASCVLGGGTAINAGLWWRPADYDWDFNFPANSGWGSSDLAAATERVFTKIPGTHTPSTDGQLYLQQGAGVLEYGFQAAGWTRETSNDTPNQRTQERVFTNTTFMYEHGERGGPMATYLVEAYARPNFELWQNTMVERVVRDGSTVTGLELKSMGDGGHDGNVSISSVGGAVILSAGAFGTPKILFRSGIGPQDSLEVVQQAESDMISSDQWINLPVGYNLVDNINTDMVISHPNVVNYDWLGAYDAPIQNDEDAYLDSRTGILTQCGSNLNPMVWEPVTGTDGNYRQLQWTARVSTSLGIADDDGHDMVISNYLGLGQIARGRTTINSDLNMIVATSPVLTQNAADRDAIIQGIESMRSALSNVSDLTFLSPTADVSAADYVDATEHAPVNHWLGSCKLGTDDGRVNDGTAVVDPDTKVYGMDNLFVVDGSIFPGLTTANPSAMIVIAAEQAAVRILALRA